MDAGLLLGTVGHVDTDKNILGRIFGVFYGNIKITVLIKNARIQKFIFRLLPRAYKIFIQEFLIRECLLRVFIEELHVGMGRRIIKIKIILLNILTVIAFLAA